MMGKSRRRLLSALCMSCAVLTGAPSWSATIEPGQGDLTLNQGQGFKSINGRVDANVGDSVMVGPGGVATVIYADGCKVSVQPGAVTTIAPISPCASGSNAADMGIPPAVTTPQCPPGPDGRPDCGPVWWEVAVGVALAGAAFGVAAYEASKSNGTTTPVFSPASNQ
jgi:hypothetical protein